MIPWFVDWFMVIFLVPIVIFLIWTALPIKESGEFQKKRWEKKWKKMFPELYKEE